MLIELFPRAHARFLALPLLGPLLDGFARWLSDHGFAAQAIRGRVRKAPVLEELLLERRLGDLSHVCKPQLLALTAGKSQKDRHLSALVRSLADFLEQDGLLATTVPTPGEQLVDSYRLYLEHVRGLAASTQAEHRQLALGLLDFLGFDHNPAALTALSEPQLEAFMMRLATGCGLSKLQNRASFLRSFLRFLAGRGEIPAGLDLCIDGPRASCARALPRALPWESVRAFLAGIDRDTAKGRRDYAMFLLIATYGLRISEVAALRLDDIGWRSEKFRVQRPKVRAPLALPLTDEAGAALADYLRHSRPPSTLRAVFLGTRRPVRPLSTAGIQHAFSHWMRVAVPAVKSATPHCLRHAPALHLLRQNTSVKVIGDLLGHRRVASTGTYLRLHSDDLRAAALELPDWNGGQR